MERVEVVEGTTRFIVPKPKTSKGPAAVGEGPFYNPAMAFSRSVTVALLDILGWKGAKVLDGLAAAGARGLRYANEVAVPMAVTLNDADPEAVRASRENAALNGIAEKLGFQCRKLNSLLSEERFDIIDLDPFGSPAPFMDAAFQSVRRKGMVFATATDTAPLSGTYVKTCLRRYGARPLRCPIGHEIGLRILLGFAARTAARYDIAVTPKLCFYSDHFFRLHVAVAAGAGRTDRALENLGYLRFDRETGVREWGELSGNGGELIGPLWLGPLFDTGFMDELKLPDHLREDNKLASALEVWRGEAGSTPFFFETNEIGSRVGGETPPMAVTLETLKDAGFQACRTHFSPTGFRTDATLAEMVKLFK